MALRFQLAAAEDSPATATVALRSFHLYRSHYHTNPLLEPARITEGYAEWAILFVRQNSPELEAGSLDRTARRSRHRLRNLLSFATGS